MFVLSGVLLAHPQQQQQQQQRGSFGPSTLLDSCNLPHLNRATAQGNLCLLTVRESSAADCCAELAQLLNVYKEFEQSNPPGSLADKFKGMQASLQQADAGLDMVVLHLDAASSSSSSTEQQQQQQQGPQDQQQQHLQEPHPVAAAVELLAWLDRTLRYLNNSSAFKDTVLLTVVATPGAAGPLPAAVPLLQAAGGVPVPELPSGAAQQKDTHGQQEQQQQQQQQQQRLAGTAAQGAAVVLLPAGRPVLRPLQSWQQLGGEAIAVDARRPLLCMRRLPGVIRRDGCNRFSLAECCSSSGVLGLLADRLLPEVAYKLGRALKYGA
ncbi:hypothetical protein OEZ86_002505 [Tetradesmus obliquus]|nr:hypothetical protein OEZ86_002505 [Tetradesmus obliquus]